MMVAVGHEFHSICCEYYYLARTSVLTPLVGYLFLAVPLRELTAASVRPSGARTDTFACMLLLLFGNKRQTYVTSLSFSQK
jgi:hypothetical protein